MSLESMYLPRTLLNTEWKQLRGMESYLGLAPICEIDLSPLCSQILVCTNSLIVYLEAKMPENKAKIL